MILVSALLLPSLLFAAPQLPEMRVQGHLEPSHTSSLNHKNIKKKHPQNAVSLFNAHPSLEIKNVGGTTSLFIRGTNSAHNIVIINGLTVNNPSINNQFDFSTLDPHDIEKVEIITGAKALYYGSGALGGVINITTKKARQGTQAKGRVELGSFDTRKTHVSLGHRSKNRGFFGQIKTGTSGKKTRWNSHHKVHNADRHRSTTGFLFLDAEPSKNHTVTLYLQGDQNKTHINTFTQGKYQYSGDRTFNDSNRLALNNGLSLMDDRWRHNLILGHQNTRRKTLSTPENTRTYIAKRQSAEYETTFDASETITLGGGLSYATESDDSPHTPGKTFDSKGMKAKIDLSPLEVLDLFFSARLDKHERFKAHGTWQSGASLNITNTTTLEASIGTGFKAPSIQTFVGTTTFQEPNTKAKPEKSFLWDISLKNSFFHEKMRTKITYFMNEIKDVLTWDRPSKTMLNKNKRNIRGTEVSINYALNKRWEMGGTFTYLRVIDRDPVMRALSIPRYKTTFNLHYDPTEHLSFFTEVVHKSRQMNYNNKRVKAVTDMRLGGRYHWSKSLEIFGRLENALNQKREESYGFGRRGTGLFGGFILKT